MLHMGDTPLTTPTYNAHRLVMLLSIPSQCPPTTLLQVFAMPIFDAAEAAIRRRMRSPPRPLTLRLLFRSSYVAVVTLGACALPFFGELM